MVGGHNNQSTESLNIMLEMTKVNIQKKIQMSLFGSEDIDRSPDGREEICTAAMQNNCLDCVRLFKI